MSPYLVFAWLLGVAMLQTAVMPHFSLWGVMPDVMLLVVISWSLLRGSKEAILWALVGGVLLDLLSGGVFGAATVALALSSLVMGLGELNIFHDAVWLPVAASALATVVYDVVYLAVLHISGRPVLWARSLLQVVVPSIALNALSMYPVYWVMRWLQQRTSPRKIEW